MSMTAGSPWHTSTLALQLAIHEATRSWMAISFAVGDLLRLALAISPTMASRARTAASCTPAVGRGTKPVWVSRPLSKSKTLFWKGRVPWYSTCVFSFVGLFACLRTVRSPSTPSVSTYDHTHVSCALTIHIWGAFVPLYYCHNRNLKLVALVVQTMNVATLSTWACQVLSTLSSMSISVSCPDNALSRLIV